MRRRTDGFTLVELMVVVLIIGILVAVAVPVFKAARAISEKNTCWANQRTIEGAFENYQASTGGVVWNQSGDVSASDLVTAGYLKSVPQCPAWKTSGYGWTKYTVYNVASYGLPNSVYTSRSDGEMGLGCLGETGHGHYSIKGADASAQTQPDSVSGLSLWLKADAITGVADGADLSGWPDSAVSRTIPASGWSKPKYLASAIGGMPAVHMTGGCSFDPPNIRQALGGYTVIAVSRRTDQQLWGQSWERLFASWDGKTTYDWQLPGICIAGGTDADGVSLEYGPDIIYHSEADGYTLMNLRVGRAAMYGFHYYMGEIAEIIVYDRQLTPVERSLVTGYLSSKYGI